MLTSTDRIFAVVTYRKTGRLRFLGHLDVARTMDRAVRRAKLPVAYSQGFAPRAELGFANPLPVGMAGERELFIAALEEHWEVRAVHRALAAQLPPDLGVEGVGLIPRTRRSPFADLGFADYKAEMAPAAAEGMAQAVERFVAMDSYIITRRTKSREVTLDIRSRVFAVTYAQNVVQMKLGLAEDNFVKPEEVCAALAECGGSVLARHHMTRTALYMRDGTLAG